MILVACIFVIWTRNSDVIVSTGRIEPYISAIQTSGCCKVVPMAFYLFAHLKNVDTVPSKIMFNHLSNQ